MSTIYNIREEKEDAYDLYYNNIGLVTYVMHSLKVFTRVRVSTIIDDIKQEGLLALWVAVNTWNKEKGSLSNYAFIRIRGTILRYLTKIHAVTYPERRRRNDPKVARKEIVSISAVDSKSPHRVTLEESLEDRYSEESDDTIFFEIKPILNTTEWITIIGKYYYGKEETEIMAELGKSRSFVSKSAKSALIKLRNYFGVNR